jgi:hypothetical protein
VHNFIPIFTRYDTKEHCNARYWSAKVGSSAYLLTIFHSSKENCTSESVEEHQQEHPKDDEERFTHRHGDSEN